MHSLGLIGAGKIARVHAANLAGLDGARLAAVADVVSGGRTGARGRDRRRPVDAEALLGRDDVEAVLVTTPPDTHVDVIVAAAEAGKHVFCEKPLAHGVDEARRARRGGRGTQASLLQIGYNRRFDPSFRAVRDGGSLGRVGAPLLVRISSRDPSRPRPRTCRSRAGSSSTRRATTSTSRGSSSPPR